MRKYGIPGDEEFLANSFNSMDGSLLQYLPRQLAFFVRDKAHEKTISFPRAATPAVVLARVGFLRISRGADRARAPARHSNAAPTSSGVGSEPSRPDVAAWVDTLS